MNTAEDMEMITRPQDYIGKKVHLSWARRGCVWVLLGITDNGYCVLETPMTGKLIASLTIHLRKLK